ncbi:MULTISPECIES: hypothetical protein [Streptomyces]|uniref:hypothetical protein n=1 Tax=Streptomyces TaxID=1883 RepID=UPI001988675D|nr:MULTISPECIES: hypothetical protein [Streptomyces]UFR02425.1 hypothetical protein KBP30_15080 [Streptomyces sp. Go40/10]GGS80231.1 hypothetical protein GCM10010206_48670 [Streptomyces cinerochromogenes]
MNGNQIEGLIGMLATLGILVLLILPSALGALREWRIDRQLRQAERPRPAARQPAGTAGPLRRHRGLTRHA